MENNGLNNQRLKKRMEKKYGKNRSTKVFYLKNVFRYWRKTFRMMFYYNKIEWSEITVDELYNRFKSSDPPLILDIRTLKEFVKGHIPNARLIPITKLKDNFNDLQSYKEKEVITLCPGGGLSLVAVDILVEAGFKDVKSLRDGLDAWTAKGYPITQNLDDQIAYLRDNTGMFKEERTVDKGYVGEIHYTVDARNLLCPTPVLKSKKAIKSLNPGQVLEVLVTDPRTDIPSWARSTGQELLLSEENGPKNFRFLVKKVN